jgi:hypothetical protein
MLLRKYTDYETRLGLGQLFGLLGMIGLIASGALGTPSVYSLVMEPSRLFDFLRGFTAGVSGAMLGLSVVFVSAALVSIRNNRANRR